MFFVLFQKCISICLMFDNGSTMSERQSRRKADQNPCIKLAALGRSANVGDLYDARSDRFFEMSIFKDNINHEEVILNQDYQEEFFEVLANDTLSEKFSKIGVTDELQLSVLANLFTIE